MANKDIDDSLLGRGIEANPGTFIDWLRYNIIGAPQTWVEGKTRYDPLKKAHVSDTGYTNVSNIIGRDTNIEVYNDTGVTIAKGDPVSWDSTFTGVIPNGVPPDSTDIINMLSFLGLASEEILDGETGLVTSFGQVENMNTRSLAVGFIYADDTGWFTQTRPLFPQNRLIVGVVVKTGVTDGIIQVNFQLVPRRSASRTYTFSSSGLGAGVHYIGGFYDWASTSVTLDQGSLTQTYGTVGRTKAAHVGIVPLAAGTCDTGQVGLRVTGTKDSETGVQLAAQTDIITTDITTLTANVMDECVEKFSGQVTLSLYVVSGTPTAYSLTFNYGYSKYEDFANTNGTVTAFDVKWIAGTTDSAFNIELMHHKATGWTYAASGFIPGNSYICNRLVDQGIEPNLVAGSNAAYKRTQLNTFISSSLEEGTLVRITTGAPGTITNLDAQIVAFSEELI